MSTVIVSILAVLAVLVFSIAQRGKMVTTDSDNGVGDNGDSGDGWMLNEKAPKTKHHIFKMLKKYKHKGVVIALLAGGFVFLSTAESPWKDGVSLNPLLLWGLGGVSAIVALVIVFFLLRFMFGWSFSTKKRSSEEKKSVATRVVKSNPAASKRGFRSPLPPTVVFKLSLFVAFLVLVVLYLWPPELAELGLPKESPVQITPEATMWYLIGMLAFGLFSYHFIGYHKIGKAVAFAMLGASVVYLVRNVGLWMPYLEMVFYSETATRMSELIGAVSLETWASITLFFVAPAFIWLMLIGRAIAGLILAASWVVWTAWNLWMVFG